MFVITVICSRCLFSRAHEALEAGRSSVVPSRLFGAIIAGFLRAGVRAVISGSLCGWEMKSADVLVPSERKTRQKQTSETLQLLRGSSQLLFPSSLSAGTCTSPTCWSALQRSSGRRWTERSVRFCSSAVWGNPSLWPSIMKWGSCSGSTRTCDASRAATSPVSLNWTSCRHSHTSGEVLMRLLVCWQICF